MNKLKFSVKNLLNNDKLLMIVSIIIAVCLWVTVSPKRETVINCPVTLTTKNSSAEKLGLEIISDKEYNIGVSVSGDWYTLSELSSDDIVISYSFGSVVDSGDYQVAITATKANNAADFTIDGVTPDKITVSMDHISTVKYPIEVVANNIVADEGLILGTPIIDNEKGEIEITGPASKLTKLKKVVAQVDETETLSKSKVFTCDLKFLNKKGKEIDVANFTLPYTQVDVIVPINLSKTVPIKAQFSNVPEGLKATPIKYTLSQEKIELLGTKEALSKIDSITLDPIDYTQLTPENNKFVIALNLPSGITASNGVAEITVKIDMSKYTAKTVNISNVTTANLSKDTSATVETTYKSVVVVGSKNVIDELSEDEVYIECDMSNSSSSEGSVIVEGIVKSKKYKTIWGTGDTEITIKVENS